MALRFARSAPRPERLPGRWWILGAGAVLGVLLWHVAGEIGGDGLFHLARVRKLDAFDSLSLDAVNEFADGGLHPGYAFPLWHGFLALVARVAFLDPADVVLHEASILAPIALLVAYEAGYALFRRVGPAVAVVCAQVAVTALAPAHGGAYTALGLPATASRQLLVPAALALAFAYVERPTRGLLASTAAAGLVLAVIHPTYAIFLWLPFAGFLVVRSLVARDESKRIAAALAALVVPAAAYLVWLLPVVRDTASHAPDEGELQRAFQQYAGQLDVFSDTSYRLAPEVFGRGGAVAIAALLFVPLAGLALRRRWAAYVLGGFLAVAAVMLVPRLFVPFSDLVSLSQSRRAAGFWPLAFAFAGGLTVLAAILRSFLLPVALAGRDRAPARLPGRVRLPARARRAGARDLVRRRRRRRRSRARALLRDAARVRAADEARRRRRGALRAPDRGPRGLELEPFGRARREPADAGPGRGAARGRAEGRRCLLGHRDELPDRRRGARLHRGRAAEPRRGHGEEPALRSGARPTMRFFQHRRPGDPASGRRGLARRRPEPLRPAPQLRTGLRATTATRSTGCRSEGSTIAGHEAVARHALLAAGGRRRRPAAAQVRAVPAGARDRDPRARARRLEVDPRGRRPARADAGLGAPRALPRAEGPQAG